MHSKYGANWSLMKKHLPGKSARQIRDRYLNVILPQSKQFRMFKESDDAKLLSLYELYPNSWKKISEFFKGKNPAIIKERFFYLKSKVTGELDMFDQQRKNNCNSCSGDQQTVCSACVCTSNGNSYSSDSSNMKNRFKRSITQSRKNTNPSSTVASNEESEDITASST